MLHSLTISFDFRVETSVCYALQQARIEDQTGSCFFLIADSAAIVVIFT